MLTFSLVTKYQVCELRCLHKLRQEDTVVLPCLPRTQAGARSSPHCDGTQTRSPTGRMGATGYNKTHGTKLLTRAGCTLSATSGAGPLCLPVFSPEQLRAEPLRTPTDRVRAAIRGSPLCRGARPGSQASEPRPSDAPWLQMHWVCSCWTRDSGARQGDLAMDGCALGLVNKGKQESGQKTCPPVICSASHLPSFPTSYPVHSYIADCAPF